MRPHYAVLLGTLLSLLTAAPAHAYTLGAADGSTDAAPIAKHLGASSYRVVMDPKVPIDAYAPRIDAYRALGMRPQLVIGGTGTDTRGKTGANWQIINYAIHAAKRWSDAYSISVINEPDLAGGSACQYAKTFKRAYKMLKRAGVKRVLFGEWSPSIAMGWTPQILTRCGKQDIVADGYAWHCYDQSPKWGGGIGAAGSMGAWLRGHRGRIHTRAHRALPMFCTEYGAITRTTGSAAMVDNDDGARMWRNALRVAKREGLRQIVAWGITEAHSDSVWDSSLVNAAGEHRAAFGVIASRNSK